jgi:hypothetical protein
VVGDAISRRIDTRITLAAPRASVEAAGMYPLLIAVMISTGKAMAGFACRSFMDRRDNLLILAGHNT